MFTGLYIGISFVLSIVILLFAIGPMVEKGPSKKSIPYLKILMIITSILAVYNLGAGINFLIQGWDFSFPDMNRSGIRATIVGLIVMIWPLILIAAGGIVLWFIYQFRIHFKK